MGYSYSIAELHVMEEIRLLKYMFRIVADLWNWQFHKIVVRTALNSEAIRISADLGLVMTSRAAVQASYKKLKGTVAVKPNQLEWIPTPGQSSAAPVTIAIGLIRSNVPDCICG
jgi:hypothetical protein